ncbi:odorant receptor 63a-like [Anopheles bellator]|uniref:odorant receptor 63a-like n=1 Tax=Anopheles bellator TaxID=139047 RepID=UPI00264A02EF|nr:odorant receptor 63a-like [Anopheles bellator]
METEQYHPGSGFTEHIRTSTYWLRSLSITMGVWPAGQVSMRARWYRALYYFVLMVHWFNTYLQTEFFFRNLGNLTLVVQGLCSFLSISTTGFKLMRLHAYEDELSRIWQTLEESVLFRQLRFLRKGNTGRLFGEMDQIVARQWKEVQLNLRFYTLVVGAVATMYSIIPLGSNLYHVVQGHEFNRSFVYNTYYPHLDTIKRRSPLYELLFCSESLSGYTTFAGVIAFDALYVVLVLYASSLVRLLNIAVQETTNTNFTDQERAFFLRECLLHHIRVKRLVEQINEVFSPILLVQLFTSTSIICVIAFAASFNAGQGESETMLMVLYLIAAIYQLFQFCWYGQRLQNESSDLPLAIYSTQWELCAQEFKSSYHILLLHSQRQIDICAWSFSAMSLETFCTIIRSAASYFTVLQTLEEE